MAHFSFTDHPHSVGETYLQHLGAACGFGVRMIGGGLACLVHGVLPFLCTSTGSSIVRRLYERMIVKRARRCAAGPTEGVVSRS